jgi:hypothetical protein
MFKDTAGPANVDAQGIQLAGAVCETQGIACFFDFAADVKQCLVHALIRYALRVRIIPQGFS